MNSRQVKSAGLAIFRMKKDEATSVQKVEWLLLQDNPRSHHWTPPKGHIDPGESAMEAAMRETLEESGSRLYIK